MNICLTQYLVGAYYGQGTPVPIPNTVVKLIRAENTRMATSRKDRSVPTQIDQVSDFRNQGTPVPIPNTVVKLFCAENTRMATSREDKSSLTFLYSSLAQSVRAPDC